jgi:hypothetical protein
VSLSRTPTLGAADTWPSKSLAYGRSRQRSARAAEQVQDVLVRTASTLYGLAGQWHGFMVGPGVALHGLQDGLGHVGGQSSRLYSKPF